MGAKFRNNAFTLVEALMGSLVLTVALVGSYSAWIFIQANLDRGRAGAAAGEIARAEIERFKVFGIPSGYTAYPTGTCTSSSGTVTYTPWSGSYDKNDSNGSTDQYWHSGYSAYYDDNGNQLSSFTGARFKVSDTVTDANVSLISCSSSPPYGFNSMSSRTVVVSVQDLDGNGSTYTSGAILVQGGV